MYSRMKTFLFAGILCLSCSLLLTAAATGLKSYQQRNVAADKQKNILKAVGLLKEGSAYSLEQVESLYKDSIRSLWIDSAGLVVSEKDHSPSDLPLYIYVKQEQIMAYVVPIDTRGLWGPIHGYLALDADGSTVRGFTVYQHQETPGLGGEIEKRWFQKNFQGKKIVDQSGHFVSISVAKGAVKEIVPEAKRPYYVDGISGATMTGKFLTEGLKDILGRYESVGIRFRKHEVKEMPERS